MELKVAWNDLQKCLFDDADERREECHSSWNFRHSNYSLKQSWEYQKYGEYYRIQKTKLGFVNGYQIEWKDEGSAGIGYWVGI